MLSPTVEEAGCNALAVRRILASSREGVAALGEAARDHVLPPPVPKAVWSSLGDNATAHEHPEDMIVTGDQWLSLRLDGCNFGRFVGSLRDSGVIARGYSPWLADLMRECCRELMNAFGARCGFTQSDEITVLIPPAPVVRGKQHSHTYSGRVQKLASIAASTATARFLVGILGTVPSRPPPDPLPRFDCRVGSFVSEVEAMGLVMWRAYDCSVNGVSDAVHHHADRDRNLRGANTGRKLEWLREKGLLPLPAHQAHGSFYLRVAREREAVDPRTGGLVTCMRSAIDQLDGCLLTRLAQAGPDASINDLLSPHSST